MPFTDTHMPFAEYGLHKPKRLLSLYHVDLRRPKRLILFGIHKGPRFRAMPKSEKYFVELIDKLKLLKSFGILKLFFKKGLRPPAGRPREASGGRYGS